MIIYCHSCHRCNRGIKNSWMNNVLVKLPNKMTFPLYSESALVAIAKVRRRGTRGLIQMDRRYRRPMPSEMEGWEVPCQAIRMINKGKKSSIRNLKSKLMNKKARMDISKIRSKTCRQSLFWKRAAKIRSEYLLISKRNARGHSCIWKKKRSVKKITIYQSVGTKKMASPTSLMSSYNSTRTNHSRTSRSSSDQVQTACLASLRSRIPSAKSIRLPRTKPKRTKT